MMCFHCTDRLNLGPDNYEWRSLSSIAWLLRVVLSGLNEAVLLGPSFDGQDERRLVETRRKIDLQMSDACIFRGLMTLDPSGETRTT